MVRSALALLLLVGCAPADSPAEGESSADGPVASTVPADGVGADSTRCTGGTDRLPDISERAEASPLMRCIRFGHTEAALALIAGEADLTFRTSIGDALTWAARAGDTLVFDALVNRGVEIADGYVPLLFYPIGDGNAVMVRRLLGAGADANGADGEGRPLLSMAASMGDTAIARALLQHGADVSVDPQDEFAGGPPLVEAESRAMIEMLLDAGADVNQPESYHGQTLLWRISCHGNTDYGTPAERLALIDMLLERGADVDTRDAGSFSGQPDDGQTPLVCAVRAGDAALVARLIGGGADVNATWAGRSVLVIGREAGDATIVQRLEAAGAR